MIRIAGLTLLLLTLTSVSLDAQRDRGDDDGPVRALLELRTRLDLTDDQVTRLNAIDADLQSRNDPLVTRLVEVRRDIRALGRRSEFTPDQKARYDVLIGEARPLMRQIRDNTNAAMRQIGTVLTDFQRGQLSEILRDRDGNDGRRGDNQDSRRN